MEESPNKKTSTPSIPEIFISGKTIDVSEVNQRHWFEESGQWLENVDRTHLILAIAKPVLQKRLLTQIVLIITKSQLAKTKKHYQPKQSFLCNTVQPNTVSWSIYNLLYRTIYNRTFLNSTHVLTTDEKGLL